MKKNKILTIAVLVILSLVLSACRATDVVGKFAASSFREVVENNPNRVQFDQRNNLWYLSSPEGDRFGWSQNFSETTPDLVMEFDALPFVNAGLDPKKLPEGYVYDSVLGKLTVVVEAGQNKFEYKGQPTAADSFEKIVKSHRKLIGYHAPMDHYGISLNDKAVFEWAKDMSKNDKDIVFILDPKPLTEAGVDPSKVEGWVYAEVEVKMGTMAYKFLRPYNLK